MIHYQLICADDHAFDGWFKDSAGFDRQAKAGLVECPQCGSVAIHRALMAPAIGRKRKGPAPAEVAVLDRAAPVAPQPAASPPMSGAVMPDQVRSMLQRLRAEVEKNCEPVGDRFAEEARAIHRGEAEPRGIFGESTPEQAEALADEGIEVSRIPWVPRADG